jgi:hypothetical protein
MVAKLKAIKVELQRRKHDRTSQAGVWLRKVVTGYYQYHAVPGNIDQLRIFRQRGEACIVRYIDDFVLCFQYRADALRVQEAFTKRLGRFPPDLGTEEDQARRIWLLCAKARRQAWQ